MRFRPIGSGALLCLFVASTAGAEPPPEPKEYDRTGFYLQLGGLFALNAQEDELKEDMEDHLGTDVSLDVDNSGGLWARAGYRVNEIVALELDYEWVEGFDFDGSTAGFDFNGDITTHVWTGNLKVFPMGGRWQPYGLAGAGMMHADPSLTGNDHDYDFAMRFGLGLDAYVTEEITIVGEVGYVLPVGDMNGLDYVPFRLGVQYRF